MSSKIWGGKMKWQIFRDDNKFTTKDHEHEYQYWKFISEDLKWVFPLYARQSTELHEILESFTDDDISDFGAYLWSKDYSIEKYNSYGENLKSSRQFSQRVLSDFVYGVGRNKNKEYYILYRHDGWGGVDQYQTEYESVEHALLELSLYYYIPLAGFEYIEVVEDEGNEEMYHIYVFMEDRVVEYSLILAKGEDKFINGGDF